MEASKVEWSEKGHGNKWPSAKRECAVPLRQDRSDIELGGGGGRRIGCSVILINRVGKQRRWKSAKLARELTARNETKPECCSRTHAQALSAQSLLPTDAGHQSSLVSDGWKREVTVDGRVSSGDISGTRASFVVDGQMEERWRVDERVRRRRRMEESCGCRGTVGGRRSVVAIAWRWKKGVADRRGSRG
jgi:hypothetical protein